MTKEEYLTMHKKPVKEWTYEEAKESDQLIKETSLKNLESWLSLKGKSIPETLKTWILTYARFGLGSVETDDLFIALDLYPDWREYGNSS